MGEEVEPATILSKAELADDIQESRRSRPLQEMLAHSSDRRMI
jgi:hypothetical protein